MGRLITYGAWLSHSTEKMKMNTQGGSLCGTEPPTPRYLLEGF